MPRKKSEFLSGFGTAFEMFKGIVDEVIGMGGGDEDLRHIITDSSLRRKLAELIVSASKQKAEDIFAVSVEYDKSVADLIQDGRYNRTNSNITEKNFPSSESGVKVVEFRLIHFNKVMSSEAVLSELDRLGLRPAALKELLAFGATYKEEQRKYPIVALGSVWQYWDGDRYVPVLAGDLGDRDLVLGWFEYDWCGRHRFLAISKPARNATA